MTSIKIAYIGGGSKGWARMLMNDLALTPHLGGEIALYDIDYEAAQRNVTLGGEIYAHPDAQTTFTVTNHHDPADALRGADFVVMSILPGPMTMFANDLDIPARYGILQSVGDTTGPGGISRAMCTIPIYEDYAHQIMQYCPDAWVINYTNPMTLCTRALYAAEPDIKAFGCCHEVFGTQKHLATVVAEQFEIETPPRTAIKTDIAGVNHFTFATTATWNGEDLFPVIEARMSQPGFWDDQSAFAQAQQEHGKWFDSQHRVAYDLYRRFGVLGAAGDRHLAEFVPWHLESEATLHRYGVVLTPSSYRLGTWQPPQNADWPREEPTNGLRKSGEEGVEQMLALLGLIELDTNVNLPNRGQMPDLPLGAVVETNAQFRRDRVAPIVPKPLTPGARLLVRRVAELQELTLEACRAKSFDLAFQALLNDPLVTIPVDDAYAMFNELNTANQSMLEGWS